MTKFQLPNVRSVLAAHHPSTQASALASRKTAVAIILRDQPHHGTEALFIQRAEHPLDPWSGQMAFPGGHQEHPDEKLEEVARRETFEEVGIRLDPERLLGRLDDLAAGRLMQMQMSVSPFIYSGPGKANLKTNAEVADTVWVPLSFLSERANLRPFYYAADPEQREFASFQFQERYTIWGLTYRMICSFMSLFDVALPEWLEEQDTSG